MPSNRLLSAKPTTSQEISTANTHTHSGLHIIEQASMDENLGTRHGHSHSLVAKSRDHARCVHRDLEGSKVKKSMWGRDKCMCSWNRELFICFLRILEFGVCLQVVQGSVCIVCDDCLNVVWGSYTHVSLKTTLFDSIIGE